MKKVILSALLIAGGFMVKGQTVVDTVTIGAGAANNVWYSLENGTVTTTVANNWDLAFQANGLANAGVRANGTNGVEVYYYGPITDWNSVDTNGFSWERLYNSQTTWNIGAVNMAKDAGNQFDYGWGEYNMQAHQVNGSRMFIIKMDGVSGAVYKKFKIDSLAGPNASIYYFSYADLDGNNQIDTNIDKDDYTGHNYVYFSIQSGSVLNRENTATLSDWDLYFGKYIDSVENPMQAGVFQPYDVVGVLSSPKITVNQVDGVTDSSTYTDWSVGTFSANINEIGHDWKVFNMTTYVYDYAAGRVYFVKTSAGDVWKLVFLAYDSSAGDIIFSKEKISTAGLTSFQKDNARLIVYPNPASSKVSVLLDNVIGANPILTIQNMEGQIVYQNKVANNNKLQVNNIPVSNLNAGVYFVNVNTTTQSFTQKLVIR